MQEELVSVTNKIYSKIKEHKTISFDALFELIKSENISNSKQEFSQYLRIIENEQKIIFYNSNYYDLASFENIEGFPHWNLNGFCWLEKEDLSNSYGVTFNPKENLLSIYNKKNIGYGEFVKGKKITIDDKEFVYVLENIKQNNKKIIFSVNLEKNILTSLNSNLNYNIEIPSDLKFKHDDIVILNSIDFSLVEILGNKKDFGIESKIIEHLSELKNAPDFDSKIYNNVYPKLNKNFFTIDSIYTKDIDDAIAIEKNNGKTTLYVAIADVSSYVLENDNQDLHAQEQSSSFYLPHKTFHMLHKNLSENYCSLNVGNSRNAMICEISFDNISNEIIDYKFYPSEITSKYRLSYDDVDLILNNQNPKESYYFDNNEVNKITSMHNQKDIIKDLNLLYDFSQIHKKINDNDYWINPTPDYKLNDNGKISELYYKNENIDSQKMVETAMLLANISAAKFLAIKYPNISIFRNQAKPLDGERPKSAVYHNENEGHWGLKTEFYTHFTSPIRRYCDLLVHRLIKKALSNEPVNNEKLISIINKINIQQYKAKQNDLKAYNLLLNEYVEDLNNNNKLNDKLKFIDFSENGVVLKNEQNIEFFIPKFKLENYVLNVLNDILSKSNDDLSIEDKEKGLKLLNNRWEVFFKLAPYNWTDERKNCFYQFSRKEKKHIPSLK